MHNRRENFGCGSLKVKSGEVEYRQFGGIQASVKKSFYRKSIGVMLQNIDVVGRVLSQISGWL